jgi:cation diffusion facilitator CzcD-associated flavoprotein CzcO
MNKSEIYDCIIIGGGQSALACAYFFRRTKRKILLIDKNSECGGSWNFAWDSLQLFSPVEFNVLPGWPMPIIESGYPKKSDIISYLCEYEKRYDFPIKRGVSVESTFHNGKFFELDTSQGIYKAKSVISATGTYGSPFIPNISGLSDFQGIQLHSADYRNPEDFEGKNVLVVGEGNSGAQLVADLYKKSACFWAVKGAPQFLPPEVDGRVLFDSATKIYQNRNSDVKETVPINLGNIVRLPKVKEAEEDGAFKEYFQIEKFEKNGVLKSTGAFQEIDVVIWCTGFNYNTKHLKPLIDPDERGKVMLEENQSLDIDGLWLVGYGGWTGFASATIIGIGRTAKSVVKQCDEFLDQKVI